MLYGAIKLSPAFYVTIATFLGLGGTIENRMQKS